MNPAWLPSRKGGGQNLYRGGLIAAPGPFLKRSLKQLNSLLSRSISRIIAEASFPIFRRFLSLLLVLGTLSPLYGETGTFSEVHIHLSWSAVQGNRGYVVQLQDESQTRLLQETKVKSESVDLIVKPGQYFIRISALNKFGKSSAWTPWKSFSVTGKTENQTLDAVEKEEESIERETEFSFFSPAHFVPGLTRMSHGSPLAGSLFAGLFVASTAYGISEGQRATAIAHEPMNDPVLLSLLLYQQDLPVLLFFRQERESRRLRYEQFRRNQQIAFGVAALIYGAQYLDAVLFTLPDETGEKTALFTGGHPDGSIRMGLRFSVNWSGGEP